MLIIKVERCEIGSATGCVKILECISFTSLQVRCFARFVRCGHTKLDTWQ